MNKAQKVVLTLTLCNLLLILLFPPFDDYSVTNNDIAIFGGFRFILSKIQHTAVNSSLLYLEVAVVLVNAGILWILSMENSTLATARKFNFRKATLALIAINLVVILMFPPFEYVSNMTRAIIPTFEGFYFIFSHPPFRVIVTPILWLEVIFVLINGGLFLLAFKEKQVDTTGAEQTMAFLAKMQGKR